jgi:hypothetical protein
MAIMPLADQDADLAAKAQRGLRPGGTMFEKEGEALNFDEMVLAQRRLGF